MPIIVHSSNGTVTGVSGSALIRSGHGAFRPLKVGDLVQKGDVLLTTQDGIVEFTRADAAPPVAAPPVESIPALIAAIEKGDPTVAPAAGLVVEDGTGLIAAERIARVSEQIDSRPPEVAVAPFVVGATAERRLAPESFQPPRPEGSDVIALEEGPPVGLRLSAPATGTAVATLTVDQLPAIGEVRKADGTALAVGAVLTAAELQTLVYLPPDEYDGRSLVGAFGYTVSTALTSLNQSVRILVRPVNDAPTAASEQGSADEDRSAALTLAGQDVDGNVVGFTLLDIPSSGRVVLADGVTRVAAGQTLVAVQAAGLRFVPNADFNGDAEIRFSAVDDGGRSSAPARYSLTFAPVNDAPRAAADSALVSEDGSTIVDVLRNDIDAEGDALRITAIAGQPISPSTPIQLPNMSVALNPDGTLTLTPRPDFNGPASFAYTVSDASLDGGASLAVQVTPVNDGPATSAVTLAAIAEDGARLITQAELLANASDIDGPGLSAAGLSISSGNGNLVNNGNGSWSYTPVLNDNSAVSFGYSVSDGIGSVQGSATLDITPVNDAPATSPVTLAAIAEDSGARLITQAELLASASDVDGPSLSASGLVIASGSGNLVNNGNGTWSYTPVLNDNSAVSFGYSVSDGTASVAGSAALDITPVNDAPATSPVTLAAIAEDSGARLITQAELLASASDVDGPSLSASGLVIASGSGNLVNNGNGTWSYTPVLNDNSAVSFGYSISDGTASVAGSAALDITPVNDAPATSPVTLAAIAEGSGARLITQAELLASASDVDGPSLSATGLAIASGSGNLVNNGNGTWSYTPAPTDDTGVSFSYSVSDGAAAVAGSATLDIAPVVDPRPVAPSLAAPSGIVRSVQGPGAATTETAITQADLERIFGIPAGTLDTFDPPSSALATDPGAVSVFDGGFANQAVSMRVGERVEFDWTFFNGEDLVGNIQDGLNDMLLLVVTDPSGTKQVVQLTSSEQTGPNVNDVAPDATGTFAYTAAAPGNYSFAWLVVNGTDGVEDSAMAVSAPHFVIGTNRYGEPVPFEISAQTSDPTAAASLRVTVSGLQAGEAFSSGADLGAGVWSFTAAELVGLAFLPAVGFVGTRTLTVGASTLSPVFGVLQAPTQPSTVTLQASGLALAAIAEDSGARLITQAELLANQGGSPSLSATSLAIGSGSGNLVNNGNGTWTYTPAPNDDTRVGFSYSVNNGAVSLPGSATLDITPVNDAPTTSPVSLAAIAENSGARLITQAELLANSSDVDGPSLTATGLAIAGGNGNLVNNGDATWTYTPVLNDDTAASFSYSVNDGTASVQGSATLDITPVTDAPPEILPILTAPAANLSSASDFTAALAQTVDGGVDNQTVSLRAGESVQFGTASDDVLVGGPNNDFLFGASGDDTLNGAGGNDHLYGGAGNDTLDGGLGADTFVWFLADAVVLDAVLPTDSIVDFSAALPALGGDVLDLRDLLVGEAQAGLTPGNLEQFLDFDTTSVAGSTLIRISGSGGFAGGSYAAAQENQRIVLEGLDLRAPAVFGLGSGATDNDIIAQLLQRGKLLADGP